MLTTADSARRTPKSHHTPEPEAKPKPAEARAGAFCAGAEKSVGNPSLARGPSLLGKANYVCGRRFT